MNRTMTSYRCRIAHSSFETPEGVAAYEFASFGELVYTERRSKVIRRRERLHAFSFLDARVEGDTLEIDVSESIQQLPFTLHFTVYRSHV